MAVRQLRLVVTAVDYDEALRFYRDVHGLAELAVWSSPDGGRVTLLDAGRATLELTDPLNAEFIDEVEVGRRVAAEPARTPWNSLNSRLKGAGGPAADPVRGARRG